MLFCEPAGTDTKDPAVVRLGDTYWMYYSYRRGEGWDIGIARSDNLLDWTFAGYLGDDARIAAAHGGIAAPGAIVIDGTIHLFYQTYPGSPAAIVHAASLDGQLFSPTGTSDRPLFSPTGNWNNGRAIDADIVRNGNELLLYWATRDPGGGVQTPGVSRSFLDRTDWYAHWQQVDTAGPLLWPGRPTEADRAAGITEADLAWEGQCIEAPAVLIRNRRFYLFYGGNYNNHPQQIGVAISADGIHFHRLFGGQPILGPGPKGSWNSSESGHPFAFTDADGQSYLFYQGDNLADGLRWKLSVCKIAWQAGERGAPDLPRLQSL